MPETPNTPSVPTPSNTAAGIPPVAPKPVEASKVQPKKETVRINLPPKPTASPTIKLPTPASAPAAQAPAPSATGAPAAPAASTSAPAARQTTAAAAPAHAAPRVPAPAGHPAASISKIDQILALAAALVAVLALVRALML